MENKNNCPVNKSTLVNIFLDSLINGVQKAYPHTICLISKHYLVDLVEIFFGQIQIGRKKYPNIMK